MKYHLIVVKTKESANWTGHKLATLLSDICVDDPIESAIGFDPIENAIGFDISGSDLSATVSQFMEDL